MGTLVTMKARLLRLLMRGAPLLNVPVSGILTSPRWGRLVNRNVAMLSYVGRRSGRTFSIPVGYRRVGDDVIIGVSVPEAKRWWRNFLGDGGPVTLSMQGADHRGHAVAQRDGAGRVLVEVRLSS